MWYQQIQSPFLTPFPRAVREGGLVLFSEKYINRKTPCPTETPVAIDMPLDYDKDGLPRLFFELSSLMASFPRITK